MIKVQSCRFQQCLGPFTLWLAVGLLKLNFLEICLIIFYISLSEAFSNSIFLIMINKYDKGVVVQISTVFGTIYHVAYRQVFLKGTF